MLRQLTRAYSLAVALAAIAFLFLTHNEATPWVWSAFWAACLALTAATPLYPSAGFAGYAAAFYGTPRYSNLFDVLASSNLLHVATLSVAVGVGLSLYRARRAPRFGSAIVILALGFFGWSLLASLVAAPAETAIAVRHDPVFLFHGAVMLIAAAQVMDDAATLRVFTLVFVVALAIRAGWEGVSGINLEGDIGPLTLMVLPLLVSLIRADDQPTIKGVALLAVVGGLAIVALTFNRASAVALVAVLLCAIWRYRRHVWILAATVTCLVAAVGWFVTSDYRVRFEQAWAELKGQGTGSVTARLELWDAGAAIAADHPWVGVGIGNYPAYLAKYSPGHGRSTAHNSFVHVAAETGIPGLLLYAGLFATAVYLSGARSVRPDQSGAVAAGLQLSMVAYLVAGLFISRHDMVLAYIFAGWVAAISGRETRSES